MEKSEKFLPVLRPVISKETIDSVVKVLESGWLATGPITQAFEASLSEYFSGRSAYTFTSATAGLHAALIAIGIRPGDEVITTPLTFVATANVIAMLGAKPVFVDIDPVTFNIDPDEVRKACTSKTKAIMPVHYAGIPVDLDKIYEIAKEMNLRVIEDAAHAMGTTYKNRVIGSFGDIQVFSFHPVKNMTTAEGGCVVLDNKQEQKALELQRFHGIDRSIWDRFSNKSNGLYDVVAPGFKSNLSDLQAAIGVHQLQELEGLNEKRRSIIKLYRELLADLSDVLSWQKDPDYGYKHSGHLFPILILDAGRRDEFMEFMKANSIGTTPYYTPLHYFTYYQKEFGYKKGDFCKAEYVGDRIVCLPLHVALEESDIYRIVKTIKNFFSRSVL